MQTAFLTDLDGTLLQSNASLSAYTIDVLTKALEQGIVISYATARSYSSSNRIVSAIPWKYPIVLYNGAVILDPLTQKVLNGHWLEREITNEIIDMGRMAKLLPFLFTLDNEDKERVWHEKLSRTGDLQFYESRPNDPRFAECTPLECPDANRTLIITYIGLLEELEPLKATVEQAFHDKVHIHFMKDPYIDNHYFLEFSHRKANKKEGLRKWAQLIHCTPEQVTAFGDNLNDLGMFELAGTCLAVANAHPQLLDIATGKLGCNDEDAVAHYISKVLS
ncbi:HAD-IIB family hydrolase [Cohnella abietis]|uniref:Sugar/pyridoxal phosphate phosphatase YigL n=1 Tax=Cohnella abietis TaxID=2507935 RepID=A0A3T1CYX1_9BACL|nr:HAD-IIB family hydrolase [Cohnella abietis]BBI31018.1 sugar/pyridoxal phosphate phosphatase YigL [Cohnella abietis]